MDVMITGGAGFIGSRLCAALLARGDRVLCVDDLSLGTKKAIEPFMDDGRFAFIRRDVCEWETIHDLLTQKPVQRIYHLAANSDIRKGGQNPKFDFEKTFLTTRTVLELMRVHDIKELFFASTSAVYGDRPGEALEENAGALAPVSYYGGAKLASEAFIHSYAAMNDLRCAVLRFPNVVGPGLTHGVIYDFIGRLRENPTELRILGDGTQTKPYLDVDDLIEAIFTVCGAIEPGVNIYNCGANSATSVTAIADIVCAAMGLSGVTYRYTGGDRGWKGDVPEVTYRLDKIHATGWRAKLTSDQAVQRAAECAAAEIGGN